MLKAADESPSVNKMRTAPLPTVARVHVLLSYDEADRFTEYCSRQGFKKSTLIARLVREYLEREDKDRPHKTRSRTPRPVKRP
jgi:hypothetical protein